MAPITEENASVAPGKGRCSFSMTISTTIAVVGLGYVGLPLAIEFGKLYPTIGFDLSQAKVAAYRRGVDPTGK